MSNKELKKVPTFDTVEEREQTRLTEFRKNPEGGGDKCLLQQKNTEHLKQIDTKFPITIIPQKTSTAKFTDDSFEHDEDAVVRSAHVDERNEASFASGMNESLGDGDSPNTSDNEQNDSNEISREVSGTGEDEAVPREAQDALPIASKVEPPKELLDRIRSLEEAEDQRATATPVDLEEMQREAREKRRWMIVGSLGVVLATLAIVLGVTLGGRTNASTPPITVLGSPPTPAPTTQANAVLRDLIASYSLDGGVALSDPLSPQSKALSWLNTDANLGSYPNWRKVQRHVLATFYFSTNGDGWIERDDWLTEVHECDWFSSAVDPACDESDRFARLVLFDNNVTGILPKDIAILSDSMLGLAFRNAPIKGIIPTELGLLSNLEFLFFLSTDMNGTIPSELGQFRSADFWALYLEDISLTGLVPSEIFALPGVEEISLSRTMLSGSIPSEIGLSPNLKVLQLYETLLTGPLPTEIGRCSLLHTLSSHSNNLNGSLISELGLLTNLVHLTLDETNIEGTICTEIGLLSLLGFVALQSLGLNGTMPSELGKLSSAEFIYLQNNSLTGSIPSEMRNVVNLIHLGLQENKLTGYIPSELGNLESLDHLWLQGNALSGSFPLELTQTTSLAGLFLSRNIIEGSLPSTIGTWKHLKHLHIDQNKFVGPLPSEIGSMRLMEAVMSENNFSGSIPSEIANLSELQILSISSDSLALNGTLPSELGRMSSLRSLALYNASIEGTLPTEIGFLKRLGVLLIGQTQITGPIPSEIGQLTQLDRLFLSRSALNGTIPSATGRLTSLIQLNLEQQNLTGTIPTELLLLTALNSFVAFGNNFIGPFTCPEFIEICGVSCGSVRNDQCRDLDEGETDEIRGEITTNLIEKVLPTDGG